MKDNLISRQAAIEAMTSGVILVTNDSVDVVKKVMELFIDKIKNLPSAEPTQTQRRANADSTQNCALDCISRQAAIDKINKLEYPSSLVDVKRIIVDLPSAQPEIIRCKDCRYTDEDGVCQSSKGLAIQDDDDYCSHAERREE